MSGDVLDPEQVAEIRADVEEIDQSWSAPMATSGYPTKQVLALCATVEQLRAELERAEEVVKAAREAEKSLATAEIHSDPSRQRRLATEAYDHLCDALQAIEEQTDEQE